MVIKLNIDIDEGVAKDIVFTQVTGWTILLWPFTQWFVILILHLFLFSTLPTVLSDDLIYPLRFEHKTKNYTTMIEHVESILTANTLMPTETKQTHQMCLSEQFHNLQKKKSETKKSRRNNLENIVCWCIVEYQKKQRYWLKCHRNALPILLMNVCQNLQW